MKKLWVGLAAAALAGVMCASLTACGTTSAKDIEGKEVTEEQWTAAFAYFNNEEADYALTAVMKYDISIKAIDPDTQDKLSGTLETESSATYTKKGSKIHYEGEGSTKISGDARRLAELMHEEEMLPPEGKNEISQETEQYAEYVEGAGTTYYVKNEETGAWTKTSNQSFYLPISSILRYATGFAQFTYSAENKGYIPKDYTPEGSEELVVIKFDKDGKLVAIYNPSTDTDGEGDEEEIWETEMSYIISYDVKDFTLPTVA